MTKKNPRDKPQRYVMLYHYMLESHAWKSLGAIPQAVYVDIAKRYHGSNNGRIAYSIRHACNAIHIGNATSKRALDTLQERGFLVLMRKGAFSLKQRHASEWRLTAFGCDVTNALPTKDFMRWEPDKNKTRMLQRNHTDAVAEAIGVCSGTSLSLNTSDGVCSGTRKPKIAA